MRLRAYSLCAYERRVYAEHTVYARTSVTATLSIADHMGGAVTLARGGGSARRGEVEGGGVRGEEEGVGVGGEETDLLSPETIKLSMICCATFAKSPNCASHITCTILLSPHIYEYEETYIVVCCGKVSHASESRPAQPPRESSGLKRELNLPNHLYITSMNTHMQ